MGWGPWVAISLHVKQALVCLESMASGAVSDSAQVVLGVTHSPGTTRIQSHGTPSYHGRIELRVRGCEECQTCIAPASSMPAHAPLAQWTSPVKHKF